jgi:hypothetical protein
MIRRIKRSIKPIKSALKRSPQFMSTYLRLAGLYHKVRLKGIGLRSGFAGDIQTDGVNPENIVWIFCTSRSGSTWLRSMMEELVACKVWEEPKVGQLFGEFYDKAVRISLLSTSFVLGDPTRKAWTRALRNFVLETARAAQPTITSRHYLIVKEPDGAIGAPLLMEALPESRMVVLIRDPRDVAASTLDARRKGSWRYELHNLGAAGRPAAPADERLNVFVEKHAGRYLRQISNARKAYDAHEGRKALIRYEDLKADALGTMHYLCSALEIPAGEEQLARIVEKHAWENVPNEEKGSGKFYRKATPGGWREDLTPEQARRIESIVAPLLEEFYPDGIP